MNQRSVRPPWRTVFMGCPEFAIPSLSALAADRDFELVAVYCQPDRPRGRGGKVQPTPVKTAASRLGVPLFTPIGFRRDPEAVKRLAALAPDWLVVVAYGLILPPDVLAIPRLGAVNLHASLLPRHRGASPIQAAILAGDQVTGNTVMAMSTELDAGDVLAAQEVEIEPTDTGGSLARKLAERGAPLLVATLKELAGGRIQPRPQDHSAATYAPKIDARAARLDWSRPATELAHRVRAMFPAPGAWFWLDDLKIRVGEARATMGAAADARPGTILVADPREGFRVACAGGSVLELAQVQRPGRTMLPARDFLRGTPLRVGVELSNHDLGAIDGG